MTSAVDGLGARFMELSKPDDDGVYRNGASKRKARTALAVSAIAQLWSEATGALPFAIPEQGVGLAAVGSLGRGQIGPSSDLDLVLIYEPHALNDSQLNALADALWYPLWDSGLDLDHSVRTRQQCEGVTDHDLPAAMGWLDVRPIAGDAELITATAGSILERWRKAARKRLPELLESAQSRLDSFGRMAYLNQPDIKEARGGLRDTVLISALAASWLADRPHGNYDDAVERLLDVRDCIHLAAAKDTDLMLTQYQPAIAQTLGLADPTLPEDERATRSIDDLQMLLARIGRQIAFSWELTSSRAKHALTHERPRFAFFQLLNPRSGGKREAPVFRTLAPGVVEHENEVALAVGAKPAKHADLPLRVAVAAAQAKLPINPLTLRNLKHCPVRDRDWSIEERTLLIRLLGAGDVLPRVWEELDFINIPGHWIPEWLGVRNRPSASAAHRYTIDQHMIEVVSRLGRVAPDGRRYDDARYAALLLAGLLHDIGKRPGVPDHAIEGARHVPVILRRLGFSEDIVRIATLLVREHLTLSEFATGRDPEDPAVAEELAARVDHDPLTLDMLFDLTRADGSSLGATANEAITKKYGWSRWRESLVRTMADAALSRMPRS
ncbi:MAG: HD domain-containing protein [Bifidobacterium subtile]|nr:HD domain-containing protein [Bifidobacterium subtile]MCI1257817.1 HD domain-containing protein [Bifidobacterium subtile]